MPCIEHRASRTVYPMKRIVFPTSYQIREKVQGMKAEGTCDIDKTGDSWHLHPAVNPILCPAYAPFSNEKQEPLWRCALSPSKTSQARIVLTRLVAT